MERVNQGTLWQLDRRLAGLDRRIGPTPPWGWVRTLRQSLGLSGWQLAQLVGVSAVRIWQIERAEVEGSLRLSTLERVAEALNCRLFYVLVPERPLQSMQFTVGRSPTPVSFSAPSGLEPPYEKGESV